MGLFFLFSKRERERERERERTTNGKIGPVSDQICVLNMELYNFCYMSYLWCHDWGTSLKMASWLQTWNQQGVHLLDYYSFSDIQPFSFFDKSTGFGSSKCTKEVCGSLLWVYLFKCSSCWCSIYVDARSVLEWILSSTLIQIYSCTKYL